MVLLTAKQAKPDKDEEAPAPRGWHPLGLETPGGKHRCGQIVARLA